MSPSINNGSQDDLVIFLSHTINISIIGLFSVRLRSVVVIISLHSNDSMKFENSGLRSIVFGRKVEKRLVDAYVLAP